jgi:hypothetical protein
MVSPYVVSLRRFSDLRPIAPPLAVGRPIELYSLSFDLGIHNN